MNRPLSAYDRAVAIVLIPTLLAHAPRERPVFFTFSQIDNLLLDLYPPEWMAAFPATETCLANLHLHKFVEVRTGAFRLTAAGLEWIGNTLETLLTEDAQCTASSTSSPASAGTVAGSPGIGSAGTSTLRSTPPSGSASKNAASPRTDARTTSVGERQPAKLTPPKGLRYLLDCLAIALFGSGLWLMSEYTTDQLLGAAVEAAIDQLTDTQG